LRCADAERRNLDVLTHGEAAKRMTVLERPGEPMPSAPMRRPARHVSLFEQYPAPRWTVEAAENVDEGGFSGPVRTDQPDDLSLPELK
jgi:hypothetical protein